MNPLQLLQNAGNLRTEIQAAADSAFLLGDVETYLALTRVFKLGIRI